MKSSQPNPIVLASIVWLALLLPLAAQTASDDYSGMYSFLKDGETIQLNLQNGQLTGWVSSFGMLESDRDTLIDHFFKQATLTGDQIHFITKPVHGCWLEFTGTIHRGQAATRAKEGYYEITGRLTEYITDENHKVDARQRDATFKSQPETTATGQ